MENNGTILSVTDLKTYFQTEDGIVKAVIKCLDPSYRQGREAYIRESYEPNTWGKSVTQIQSILETFYTFPEERMRKKKRAAEKPKSTLARAASFFW